MEISIYQSTKNRGAFISVPTSTDIETIQITEEEGKLFGEVKPFKSITIDVSDNRVAMNAEDVLSQIEKKGYAVHGAKIEFGTL